MVHFKIRYKGNIHTAKLPANWEEVDVQTFMRMEELPDIKNNYIKLLAILTGIELPIIENTKADLQMQTREALKFLTLNPPDWEKMKHRKQFFFKGKNYKVPTNLELESFGQKILLQQKISEQKSTIKCIPFAIAIYMQKVIDGEFSSDKAQALEAEILKMRIVEVYPIVVFFFEVLNEYTRYGVKGLNPSL